MQVDIERARFNMIEQQIRPWEVLDPRVLQVLSEVPREEFVPERYRDLAFADLAVPLGHEQHMMPPTLEGRMLQALGVQTTDRILEIGTGSGFMTACLARLGGQVVSVDLFPDFQRTAQEKLARLGLDNIDLQQGNAAAGWDGHGRFQVVAITGSLPRIPVNYRKLLTQGGRLFCVTGPRPVMEARLLTRVDEDQWSMESLFETDLDRLLHSEAPPAFEF
jgi:protein-L-isoaspartate(D-aspartate) O-methyltransferase